MMKNWNPSVLLQEPLPGENISLHLAHGRPTFLLESWCRVKLPLDAGTESVLHFPHKWLQLRLEEGKLILDLYLELPFPGWEVSSSVSTHSESLADQVVPAQMTDMKDCCCPGGVMKLNEPHQNT